MKPHNQSLVGKVAVVSGATRHAGRGIAIELGISGATVYCTGRSIRGNPSSRNEPGTVEETVELVEARGGRAYWVQVDHTDVGQVQALFDHVKSEQGRLDILVNSVSGQASTEPFLKSDLKNELEAIVNGGSSHIIATHIAARSMIETGGGLIVSISDKEWDQFYAMEKALVNRLTLSVAEELRVHSIAIMSILPGAFFHCFEIMTEETLQAAIQKNPAVAKCHTPRLIGRAVVALASDKNVLEKTGKLLEILDLVSEYGFTDIDGRQTGEMW